MTTFVHVVLMLMSFIVRKMLDLVLKGAYWTLVNNLIWEMCFLSLSLLTF